MSGIEARVRTASSRHIIVAYGVVNVGGLLLLRAIHCVGVGYCSVVLASILLLHEHASAEKLVGIALVALGLIFVVR